MVKQGDIIKLSFSPQAGHEQAGYRPAVVVSNTFFNEHCTMTFVCPISHTKNPFPLHIPLDERTVTDGVVLCEHLRSLDLSARPYQLVEQMPPDLMQQIIHTIEAVVEWREI